MLVCTPCTCKSCTADRCGLHWSGPGTHAEAPGCGQNTSLTLAAPWHLPLHQLPAPLCVLLLMHEAHGRAPGKRCASGFKSSAEFQSRPPVRRTQTPECVVPNSAHCCQRRSRKLTAPRGQRGPHLHPPCCGEPMQSWSQADDWAQAWSPAWALPQRQTPAAACWQNRHPWHLALNGESGYLVRPRDRQSEQAAL